jgi:predicted RNA-binding Zn-ribbon protein involved in translation (DUF1610 family)
VNTEIIELSRSITEKLDQCPVCHGKLIQKSTYQINCPTCGVQIQVSTPKSRLPFYILMTVMYSFVAGASVFIILDVLLKLIRHV